MGKKFDLIIFDWDGTLLDSTQAITGSIQAACRDLGVAAPSDVDAQQVIGLALSKGLERFAPNLNAEAFQQLIARYRHHYFSQDTELTLFPGITAMLGKLQQRGFVLAIATGKARYGLNRALETSGSSSYFSATRCADECFSKPHPQMLYELMDELDFPPERTLMVGDTSHDMQLAANAGVAGLAVSYGAHAAETLTACEPLAVLATVADLDAWFHENA